MDSLAKMTVTEEKAKDIFKYLVKKTGYLDDIYLFKNKSTSTLFPDNAKDKSLLIARSTKSIKNNIVFIKTTNGDIFSPIYGDTYTECLEFIQDIMAIHDACLRIIWYEINLPKSLEELLIEMDLNE